MKSATLCVLVLLLGGCVVAGSERGELPTGVTLIGSDQGRCDGVLEIEGDPDVTVEEGEQTVIAVADGDDIEWECRSEFDEEDGEFDCPDDTSHLRVFREEGDDEFTLECYAS